MYGLITQVPRGKIRAAAGAAIRTVLALDLAAALGGCAMAGMMGVMHGGMFGRAGPDSGGHGSAAEGREDGRDNRAPRGAPQD